LDINQLAMHCPPIPKAAFPVGAQSKTFAESVAPGSIFARQVID